MRLSLVIAALLFAACTNSRDSVPRETVAAPQKLELLIGRDDPLLAPWTKCVHPPNWNEMTTAQQSRFRRETIAALANRPVEVAGYVADVDEDHLIISPRKYTQDQSFAMMMDHAGRFFVRITGKNRVAMNSLRIGQLVVVSGRYSPEYIGCQFESGSRHISNATVRSIREWAESSHRIEVAADRELETTVDIPGTTE